MCPVPAFLSAGLRKTREEPANAANAPNGNKPSTNGDKKADDPDNKLNQDEKDDKSVEPNKEVQKEEKPEVGETEFQVKGVLCAGFCLCHLFIKSVSNLYLLLAWEEQTTDFGSGQS